MLSPCSDYFTVPSWSATPEVGRARQPAGNSGPPPRSLVPVGGVPGSGKTTLVHRFADRPGVRVIDPDTDRERVAAMPRFDRRR